jgi:hypothetical protein
MSDPLGLLMQRNLLEVFGQSDPKLRKSVINEIYTEDCIFFEGNEKIVGRDAFNAQVDKVLKGAPGFVFSMKSPPQVNHDHGRLAWALGPKGGAAVVNGMDVAVFSRGKIHALYAFLDSPPPK